MHAVPCTHLNSLSHAGIGSSPFISLSEAHSNESQDRRAKRVAMVILSDLHALFDLFRQANSSQCTTLREAKFTTARQTASREENACMVGRKEGEGQASNQSSQRTEQGKAPTRRPRMPPRSLSSLIQSMQRPIVGSIHRQLTPPPLHLSFRRLINCIPWPAHAAAGLHDTVMRSSSRQTQKLPSLSPTPSSPRPIQADTPQM
mmetsp:Transcript_54036/g.105695  ORF Transcript_54036/g.105695 Transcript_54036/m.105695 type:complete len:203 (-) Transcript_54036:730-1338(-)